MSEPLPRAAILAAWLSPWLRGLVPADDLLAHLDAGHPDAVHVVVGLPRHAGSVGLATALGDLRTAGAVAASLALPRPGDPVGLGGPPAFNTAALDVGEAVLLEGAGLGLVPVPVGGAVEWRCHAAGPAPWVDPGEGGAVLRRTLLDATARLTELDVATWQPEIPDALMNLRHRHPAPLPPVLSARDRETAERALLCLEIATLGLETPDDALTGYEAGVRRDALSELDRAARRALVGVCR